MTQRSVLVSILFIFSLTSSAWADLPLTIEDLLTEKHTFRVELGLNYANSDRDNVSALFDLIQTGSERFVLLPVDITNQRQNRNAVVITAGLRYGLTADTELYSRLTAVSDDVRIQTGTQTASQSSQRWQELIIGLNHQFSPDNDTPALLGFFELSALENTATDGTNLVHGKTGQIGFTVYHSTDPVVLSLTAGYRYAGDRDVRGQTVNPGDLFFINPSLGFAINNEVTVTGGVRYTLRGKDQVNNQYIGLRTSQTDLEFGLGYALKEHLTLNLNVSANISGKSGAQTSFNMLYNL